MQQFANISLEPQLTEITRINGQRGRVVGCYVDGKITSDILVQSELEKKLSTLNLPESVKIEKSGQKKDFLTGLSSVAFAALVSFILIFLILIFQFNSVKKSLIAFVSVPFGACAGFACLFLTGQKISVIALLGIVSLMGVVLANAILLLQFIENERSKGASIEEACRTAGVKRLRAILTSTTTATVGLLPLAIKGDTLFIPLARFLMAGLITSMIINLIFVPIIYYLVFNEDKGDTLYRAES